MALDPMAGPETAFYSFDQFLESKPRISNNMISQLKQAYYEQNPKHTYTSHSYPIIVGDKRIGLLETILHTNEPIDDAGKQIKAVGYLKRKLPGIITAIQDIYSGAPLAEIEIAAASDQMDHGQQWHIDLSPVDINQVKTVQDKVDTLFKTARHLFPDGAVPITLTGRDLRQIPLGDYSEPTPWRVSPPVYLEYVKEWLSGERGYRDIDFDAISRAEYLRSNPMDDYINGGMMACEPRIPTARILRRRREELLRPDTEAGDRTELINSLLTSLPIQPIHPDDRPERARRIVDKAYGMPRKPTLRDKAHGICCSLKDISGSVRDIVSTIIS